MLARQRNIAIGLSMALPCVLFVPAFEAEAGDFEDSQKSMRVISESEYRWCSEPAKSLNTEGALLASVVAHAILLRAMGRGPPLAVTTPVRGMRARGLPLYVVCDKPVGVPKDRLKVEIVGSWKELHRIAVQTKTDLDYIELKPTGMIPLEKGGVGVIIEISWGAYEWEHGVWSKLAVAVRQRTQEPKLRHALYGGSHLIWATQKDGGIVMYDAESGLRR